MLFVAFPLMLLVFSLCLYFFQMVNMCLSMFSPQVYPVQDSLCFLAHVREVFSYYLFKYFPQHHPLFSFCDAYNVNVSTFMLSQKSLKLYSFLFFFSFSFSFFIISPIQFFFSIVQHDDPVTHTSIHSLFSYSFLFILFSFFCFVTVSSTIQSSSSFICYSASFILIEISSSIFFILVIVLFNSVLYIFQLFVKHFLYLLSLCLRSWIIFTIITLNVFEFRDQLSPCHLVVLGFYLVLLSGTQFSAVSFCLTFCVCGLCSAGCGIVVPLTSGVCHLVGEAVLEAYAGFLVRRTDVCPFGGWSYVLSLSWLCQRPFVQRLLWAQEDLRQPVC